MSYDNILQTQRLMWKGIKRYIILKLSNDFRVLQTLSKELTFHVLKFVILVHTFAVQLYFQSFDQFLIRYFAPIAFDELK